MLLPQHAPLAEKLWNMRVLCEPPNFWPMLALWWMTCALDSLLFFFRVRAVFSRSQMAKTVLSVVWVFIGVAPVPLLYSGLYYGSHCPDTAANFASCPSFSWFDLSMLLAAVSYNTLIFVCITHELGKCTLNGKISLRTFLTGDGLRVFSKSLLRSSQLYYGYFNCS